jgi:hypothetical protein
MSTRTGAAGSASFAVAQMLHLMARTPRGLADHFGVLVGALAHAGGLSRLVACRDLLLLGAPGGIAAQGLRYGLVLHERSAAAGMT